MIPNMAEAEVRLFNYYFAKEIVYNNLNFNCNFIMFCNSFNSTSSSITIGMYGSY